MNDGGFFCFTKFVYPDESEITSRTFCDFPSIIPNRGSLKLNVKNHPKMNDVTSEMHKGCKFNIYSLGANSVLISSSFLMICYLMYVLGSVQFGLIWICHNKCPLVILFTFPFPVETIVLILERSEWKICVWDESRLLFVLYSSGNSLICGLFFFWNYLQWFEVVHPK